MKLILNLLIVTLFLIPSALLSQRIEFTKFEQVIRVDTNYLHSFPGLLQINTVYFDTDKHELTSYELDSFNLFFDYVNSFMLKHNYEIFLVQIAAHCDSRSDSSYNIELSKKRALYIEKLLIEKGVNQTMIKSSFYGENSPISSNSNEEGMIKNRRVQINLQISNGKGPEITHYELIYDTVLKPIEFKYTTESGIQIVFDTSNFSSDVLEKLEEGPCPPGFFDVKEYLTIPRLVDSELTTEDVNGDILLSGGMYTICPKNKMTGDIIVLIPIPKGCPANFDLYTDTRQGWNLNLGKIKRIKLDNGKEFYQLTVNSYEVCKKINLDCLVLKVQNCECNEQGICNTYKNTVKYFSEKKLLISEYPFKYKPITIKSRRYKYSKTYMTHNSKLILIAGDISKSKLATHRLVDTCMIDSNIVISLVEKKNEFYLAFKPLTQLKHWNFLNWNRFVIRKRDYRKINITKLEEEIEQALNELNKRKL